MKVKNMSDEELEIFDKDNIDCIPEEGKQMIMANDMMLVLRWDMQNIFILDQVIRQENSIYAQEFGKHRLGFNPSIKAFAQWVKAPNNEKPILLYRVEEKVVQCNCLNPYRYHNS